jgi:hypothetical protein
MKLSKQENPRLAVEEEGRLVGGDFLALGVYVVPVV